MAYQVGIDLGTTFTAAAVHRDGRSQIFGLGSQNASIPSVVLLREDHTELTGEAAVRRAINEPERVAREFKRRLGDSTPIIVGGAPYSAEQLMSRLLTKTITDIAEREGGAPTRVAITHPANWGPYKIDLLQQAIRIAGIPGDRVDLLTEPEAAAISYATQERVEPGEVVAVYDLGGGTFDAAVLRRTTDGFEIIGRPEGIERMGGIDFDAAVFAHVNRALDGKLQELDPEDPMVISGVARLREECVDAKIALSSDTDATIPVLLPNLQTEVRITRNEFESLIRPSLADSIAAMHRALESAGITATDVSKVLLVGGSSRIPLISQMVSSELGRPVAVDADPKHAIALGAAAYAGGALARSGGSAAAPTGDAGASGGAAGVAAAAGGAAIAGAAVGAAAATGAAAAPATPTLPSTEAMPNVPPVAPAAPEPAVAAYEPTAPMPQAPVAGAVPPGGAPVAPSAPVGGSDGDSSKLPLILGVVAAIVILGGGAFFLLGSGGDDDTDAADPAVTNEPTSDPVDESVPDTTEVVDESVPDSTEAPQVTQPPIDDATLQANVSAAVAGVTPDVAATVSGGVATLTGQTDNATADAAVAAAQGVEGVASVDDAINRLADDEVCGTNITSADRWACLDSVVFDGTTLRATFAFENAGETLNSNGGYHLHFFSDVDEPIDAGTPNGGLSNGTGNWEVWDDPTGYATDPIATFGAVPTRLCVEIANPTHSIENLDSGNCWPVEQASGFAPAGFAAMRTPLPMPVPVDERHICKL